MSDLDVVNHAPRGRLQEPRKPGRKVLHTKSGKPLEEIERKKKRRRFRGVPEPLAIDIDALPDSARLNQKETAAILRRAEATLENWRLMHPDHPLKWTRVAGRILYEVGTIRTLLKGE
jgi:hypothetical protein